MSDATVVLDPTLDADAYVAECLRVARVCEAAGELSASVSALRLAGLARGRFEAAALMERGRDALSRLSREELEAVVRDKLGRLRAVR